jgi:hypothetical protein
VSRYQSARLAVRLAGEGDADALAAFRCSTGPWYEQEVESFIRRHALRQALTTPEDYRLLLVFAGGRLAGCAAHHLEVLLRDDDGLVTAARLQLLAIGIEDQGRKLDNGKRPSDTVMTTAISDAMATHSVAVITAVTASDNLRSIALCKRHGLRSQVRYDARHVRLSGHFTPRA